MPNAARLLFLVAALMRSSDATRCYICQSLSNPACSDPIQLYQLELTECTPEVIRTSSRELANAFNNIVGLNHYIASDLLRGVTDYPESPYCQKISFYISGRQVVARGCRNRGSNRAAEHSHMCQSLKEYMYQQPDTYLDNCLSCDKDGCNSAGMSRGSWLMLVPVVVGLLLR